MDDFRFRTEDIRPDEIQQFFVSTQLDTEIINALKSLNPIILEGSRGTGKSFLLKMAEKQLNDEFHEKHILPVYLTFVASSLIHTDDPQQFQSWMLASICYHLLRALRKKGLLIGTSPATALLSRSQEDTESLEKKFSSLHQAYESSYNSKTKIDSSEIPNIENLKDAIEEICEEANIQRICFLFDEAVHIFRPEQQRQFFTLFRDLRSPYISCKAAVYPGVTSYGNTFEMTHDATLLRIERDILSEEYLASMKELVFRQADEKLKEAINRNMMNFNILAYSSSGNPRILLKTIARCPKMKTEDVNNVIKQYYRSDIWTEHTSLGYKYKKGHKNIVDWGRNFVETQVLPATKEKNDKRAEHNESTCYFWIHKDVPETVKEAIRLLEYTGIVRKEKEAVRATGSGVGTRYEIKFGCVLALENSPLQKGLDIAKTLKISRVTEYGMKNPLFNDLSFDIEGESESALKEILDRLLEESIDILDLSNWQREKLKAHNLITLRQVLNTTENQMIETMTYVGEKRARRIRNAALAEILEYLSG